MKILRFSVWMRMGMLNSRKLTEELGDGFMKQITVAVLCFMLILLIIPAPTVSAGKIDDTYYFNIGDERYYETLHISSRSEIEDLMIGYNSHMIILDDTSLRRILLKGPNTTDYTSQNGEWQINMNIPGYYMYYGRILASFKNNYTIVYINYKDVAGSSGYKGAVLAISTETGDIAWKKEYSGYIVATIDYLNDLITHGSKLAIIVLTSNKLELLNSDGKPLWSLDIHNYTQLIGNAELITFLGGDFMIAVPSGLMLVSGNGTILKYWDYGCGGRVYPKYVSEGIAGKTVNGKFVSGPLLRFYCIGEKEISVNTLYPYTLYPSGVDFNRTIVFKTPNRITAVTMFSLLDTVYIAVGTSDGKFYLLQDNGKYPLSPIMTREFTEPIARIEYYNGKLFVMTPLSLKILMLNGTEIGHFYLMDLFQYNALNSIPFNVGLKVERDTSRIVLYQMHQPSDIYVFSPKPYFGFLSINSTVENSKVYIDGQKIGTAPIENYKISTGEHTVKIVKEGYQNFTKTVTINPGEKASITASLIQIKPHQRTTTPIQTTSSPQTTTNLSPTMNIRSTLIQSAQSSSSAEMPITYFLAGLLGLGVFGGISLKVKKRRSLKDRAKSNGGTFGFPAQLLREYELLEFLGEGGFAKVFKVKRKSDGRIIALKVFPTDEKAKKFFTKEVEAWKLLNHPNIVKLHNAFEEPIPHLELEFVEGYTLNDKLIRDLEHYPKPVDEKLALNFIEGIAKGLKHAHSKQVYHRDLKPSNILLTNELTPKITDFGLAKVGSKSTTTTTKALTPLYAAPEQIDEKTYGQTDHRTDIYQLGVIFYELLTGKLPYYGISPAVVLAKITNPEIKPKPPSKHNLSLSKYDKMFEKLLAKTKKERYQSLEEFLNEFNELVSTMKKRDSLKENLKVTKETLSKTSDSLQLKKLNSDLMRLLIQNAILSAKINDKEEVLNVLYDLIPFTKKNRSELEEAIRNVQLLIKMDYPSQTVLLTL